MLAFEGSILLRLLYREGDDEGNASARGAIIAKLALWAAACLLLAAVAAGYAKLAGCGSDHRLVVFAASASGVSPPSYSVPWSPRLRVAWRKVAPEMKAFAGSDIAAHLARRGLPSTPNVPATYFVGVAQKCTASFPRVLSDHYTSALPAVKEALEHADRAWAWLETARQVARQEFVDGFLKHAAACTARVSPSRAAGARANLDDMPNGTAAEPAVVRRRLSGPGVASPALKTRSGWRWRRRRPSSSLRATLACALEDFAHSPKSSAARSA
jgi:hypothetical protein